MSTSCIMKDKVTGVTYMDMVTTSIGRVALSGPEQEETPAQGPQDRRHNRPCLRSSWITAFGQWGKLTTTVEQINQV